MTAIKLAGCLVGAACLFLMTWLFLLWHNQAGSFGWWAYFTWWLVGVVYVVRHGHRSRPQWLEGRDTTVMPKVFLRALVWPLYLGEQLGSWLAWRAMGALLSGWAGKGPA